MLASLRSFQAANQYAPFLPLDIGPAQIAQFGNAQAVVERDPDRSGVPSTVAVLLRRLAKNQHLVAAQMLAGAALLIRNPLWSELCSIFSFCRCRPDSVQHRSSPWLHPSVCSITAWKWNSH